MKYEDLSQEAKYTLVAMVEFCIEEGHCMGPDFGIDMSHDDEIFMFKHPFRKELELFVEANKEPPQENKKSQLAIDAFKRLKNEKMQAIDHPLADWSK